MSKYRKSNEQRQQEGTLAPYEFPPMHFEQAAISPLSIGLSEYEAKHNGPQYPVQVSSSAATVEPDKTASPMHSQRNHLQPLNADQMNFADNYATPAVALCDTSCFPDYVENRSIATSSPPLSGLSHGSAIWSNQLLSNCDSDAVQNYVWTGGQEFESAARAVTSDNINGAEDGIQYRRLIKSTTTVTMTNALEPVAKIPEVKDPYLCLKMYDKLDKFYECTKNGSVSVAYRRELGQDLQILELKLARLLRVLQTIQDDSEEDNMTLAFTMRDFMWHVTLAKMSTPRRAELLGFIPHLLNAAAPQSRHSYSVITDCCLLVDDFAEFQVKDDEVAYQMLQVIWPLLIAIARVEGPNMYNAYTTLKKIVLEAPLGSDLINRIVTVRTQLARFYDSYTVELRCLRVYLMSIIACRLLQVHSQATFGSRDGKIALELIELLYQEIEATHRHENSPIVRKTIEASEAIHMLHEALLLMHETTVPPIGEEDNTQDQETPQEADEEVASALKEAIPAGNGWSWLETKSFTTAKSLFSRRKTMRRSNKSSFADPKAIAEGAKRLSSLKVANS